MNYEWSVCLAAELPKKFDPEDEKVDSRINLFDPKIYEKIIECRKRMSMDGVYLYGKCEGCVCKMRLNLQALWN